MDKFVRHFVAVFLLLLLVLLSRCSDSENELPKQEEKMPEETLEIGEIKILNRPKNTKKVKPNEEVFLTLNIKNANDLDVNYVWNVSQGKIESIDSLGFPTLCKFSAPNVLGSQQILVQILNGDELLGMKTIELDIYQAPKLSCFNNYNPMGAMGDAQNAVTMIRVKHKGNECYKVTYESVGHQLWAGVYWLKDGQSSAWRNSTTIWDQYFSLARRINEPAWRKYVDLSEYEKVELYACGEGNIEFKVGHIEGTGIASSGNISLKQDWQLITIDLRNGNFSSVLPFCWVSSTPFFLRRDKKSLTFYMTDPIFKPIY